MAERAKVENESRILVLGDSITFGDYVQENETYPAVIEKYLKGKEDGRRPANRNLRVINAGVGAIDLLTEYNILIETGILVKPDIVLVGLYLNDAKQSPIIRSVKPPYLLGKSYLLNWGIETIQKKYAQYSFKKNNEAVLFDRKLFLRENKVSKVDLKTDNWKHDMAAFNSLIYENFFDWGYAWSKKCWIKIEDILVSMQHLARKNNFELVVVMLPVKYQVQSDFIRNEPQIYFEEAMNRLRIKHLDLLPSLRNKYINDKIDIYFDLCHYTPEGNSFIGKAIGNFLDEGALVRSDVDNRHQSIHAAK